MHDKITSNYLLSNLVNVFKYRPKFCKEHKIKGKIKIIYL